MISDIDMFEIKEHYDARLSTHKKLLSLLNNEDVDDYLNLALGIDSSAGNFSAFEHNLGPQVLSANNASSIIKLAKSFLVCDDPKDMVDSIYLSSLKYLKISVGSEMAMMLKPNTFWVANVRTVWTHLLAKHLFNKNKANEELKLYRSQDLTSEMEYKIWKDIYIRMGPSIEEICKLSGKEARAQGASVGKLPYMWFDAVANGLYERFSRD